MAHLHVRDTVISDRRLPLSGSVLVLGRSLDADVPIPHRSVSRRHALLERNESGFVLSDLRSVNGTFVAEKQLEPGERVPIRLGGEFLIGEVRILLVADEVIEDGEPEGALSLAPAATAPVETKRPAVSALPVLTASTEKKKPARLSPAIAQRVAARKRKRNSMRWLGLIFTVVLLGFAGYFISRIVDRERAKSRGTPESPVVEKKAEPVEIEALKIPGSDGD